MEPWEDPPQWMKDLIACLPSWIQDKLYPTSNPYNVETMTAVVRAIECIVPAFIPMLEAYLAWFNGEYSSWVGYTPIDTVPSMAPPVGQEHETAEVPGAYAYDWILGQINGGLLTVLDFLGPWIAPDNLHVQIQAIEDTLSDLTGGNTPVASNDTSRILSAVYYIAWLLWNNPIPIESTAITNAITAAHNTTNGKIDTLDTALDGLATNMQNATDDIHADLGAARSVIDDIHGDVAALDIPWQGPPVWPGLAYVTLGAPVALVDGLELSGSQDGVLVNVTTPPTKTGLYVIGGAYYDYKVGEIAFETDNGYIEPWQYLGFRQAIYTPKTMQKAAKARLRVLAGAGGTARIWTKT